MSSKAKSKSSSSADAGDVQSRIHKYQHFIEQTLQRDLQACAQLREKVEQKHTDYSSLRQSLLTLESQHALQRTSHPDGGDISRMKTMISLGSEFYVKAVVPDPTRLFLDVGLGFHVELTTREAITWIDAKLPTLEVKIARTKEQQAMIQSKIKVVYEGIAELMQLQQQQKAERTFY
jgi:prefoldin alpha subunit